ncbi:MAG: Crp/Fnr family transcriptional regulator, partial [Sporomusa sp.]
MFAEAFCIAGMLEIPVRVLATQPCQVVWIEWQKVLESPVDLQSQHGRMLQNLLHILAQKNVLLNQRVRTLSKRSIRAKLMYYLSMQAQAAQSNTFEIPFNRQQLADYLCVDRSALSSALGRMQSQGLIEFKRSRFTIKDS